MPNGYIDIIKLKIFLNHLHGNKVKPFIVNEFNSDIDDIEDYLKVKKHAEKTKFFLIAEIGINHNGDIEIAKSQ